MTKRLGQEAGSMITMAAHRSTLDHQESVARSTQGYLAAGSASGTGMPVVTARCRNFHSPFSLTSLSV
jgi:hypothetical protein